MEQRRYRMYGLVPYNLSPIQQGIQFGHAVVEYQLKYCTDITSLEQSEYESVYYDWATNDKTFIILNGGTTNHNRDFSGIAQGTLNQHRDWLLDNKIRCAEFVEPDLGNQLTAVVFLVDDRIWDKENFPDFEDYLELRNEDYDFPGVDGVYDEWEEMIGGETQVKLRKWLKQFKFA